MAYSCSLSLVFRSTFIILCLHQVVGDVYMHNPRGSNDRLNSRGQNRQNANRLFDSQNNAKGGYNVGELPFNGANNQDQQYNMKYFMSGSKYKSSGRGESQLTIEWTNQHGCGHGDLDCNIVLQYMCQDNRYESLEDRNNKNYDTIRNGKTEGTIPYAKVNMNRKVDKFRVKGQQARLDHGMHEPWEWYDKCIRRQRNKGLFTADQNVQDNAGSTKTRQNPNGNRHGYECPEERDYYPYWHPNDWKDIAVYVTKKEHCPFYEHFSFNRHPKGECLDRYPSGGFRHYSEYNNPTECRQRGRTWVIFYSFIDIKYEYKDRASCQRASTEDITLVWGVPYRSEYVDSLEIDPATNEPKMFCLVQPPKVDCRQSPLSRPNHLGNVEDAQSMNYTWIIPYFPSQVEKRCVVRIRYNISTYDYDGNSTFSNKNGKDNSPVKNDPEVEFKTESEAINFKLQLAVNTAQFGRTFQDRSHVLILMPRQSNSNNIKDDVIVHNLNVRGKRGNIVQVYPAVEYDFVPKDLRCSSDDIVHIQWTGSQSNPGGNDGEGAAGTDKSNLVEIDDSGINVKFKENDKMIKDAQLVWTPDNKIRSMEDVRVALATSGFDFSEGKRGRLGVQEKRNIQFQDQLNNSPASYSVALTFAPGSYKFMCTRNNNFSNRNQKGSITVSGRSNSRTGRPTNGRTRTQASSRRASAPTRTTGSRSRTSSRTPAGRRTAARRRTPVRRRASRPRPRRSRRRATRRRRGRG